MTGSFWNGFEKRASAVTEGVKAFGRKARLFSQGALTGAAAVGAGVGLHHAAQTPTMQPVG
jgi:hypothetical protein